MTLPIMPAPMIMGKKGTPFVTTYRFPTQGTRVQYGDADRFLWGGWDGLYADDVTYADVKSNLWKQSYPYANAWALRGYNFGFTTADIPEGSEITGFQAEAKFETPTQFDLYQNTYNTQERVRYFYVKATDAQNRYNDTTVIYDIAPTVGSQGVTNGFADRNDGALTDVLCRSSDFCVDIRAESRTGSNSSMGYPVALRVYYVKLRVYGLAP